MAAFTDIHFGKKSNDRQHNEDCLGFIKWFAEKCKEHQVDTIIFVGDYFDNRNSLHLSTLNYGLDGMEILNSLNIPVYFIVGNHDTFYREKRELSSVTIGRNLDNIHIVNEVEKIGNVLLCPWLVQDEWKSVKRKLKNTSYVFGHFELPHYMMNALVEMPDHGQLKSQDFSKVEFQAFSGHFHKRQYKDKVCYMGNAFPHDFSDNWDDDRGMMILEWGKTPYFESYPLAPKYRTYNLSELLEKPKECLDNLTYAKVDNDLDVSYDDVQIIHDVLQGQFNPRRLDISSSRKVTSETDFDENVEVHSVDQIVIDGLMGVDSVTIDKNRLVELYRGLDL